jgi:hypothetical protein
MVPQRFIFEYPKRCLELIKIMEPEARRKNLVGSFSLMVAPSLFLIPYERLNKQHPLRDGEREPDVYRALRRISKSAFLEADFWNGSPGVDWRLTRIVSPVNETYRWLTKRNLHPFAESENAIREATVDIVIRVVRNSLAHGNVVYLDKNGREEPGSEVRYLTFLSRYEETELQRAESETYRMLAVSEEGFLNFLKAWAAWLQAQGRDTLLFEAA